MLTEANMDGRPGGMPPGFCERFEQPALLRKMNEENAAFYAERTRVLNQNLANTTWDFLKVQLDVDAELTFGTRSLDRSARAAAASFAVSASLTAAASTRHFASLGGKSPKTDTLQKMIISIVRDKPIISVSQLLPQLRRQAGEGVIDHIDNAETPERSIHFYTQAGTIKTAPVSGLKDRLSRAKKISKIKSRQADSANM
jgi:hypothetical protein